MIGTHSKGGQSELAEPWTDILALLLRSRDKMYASDALEASVQDPRALQFEEQAQ